MHYRIAVSLILALVAVTVFGASLAAFEGTTRVVSSAEAATAARRSALRTNVVQASTVLVRLVRTNVVAVLPPRHPHAFPSLSGATTVAWCWTLNGNATYVGWAVPPGYKPMRILRARNVVPGPWPLAMPSVVPQGE